VFKSLIKYFDVATDAWFEKCKKLLADRDAEISDLKTSLANQSSGNAQMKQELQALQWQHLADERQRKNDLERSKAEHEEQMERMRRDMMLKFEQVYIHCSLFQNLFSIFIFALFLLRSLQFVSLRIKRTRNQLSKLARPPQSRFVSRVRVLPSWNNWSLNAIEPCNLKAKRFVFFCHIFFPHNFSSKLYFH
jgi:hypothetical protein